MKRREFVGSIASASVIGVPKNRTTIEIKIFQTRELTETSWLSSPRSPTRNVIPWIEFNYGTVFDQYDIDVKIGDRLHEDTGTYNGGELLEFEEFLEDNNPAEHCNLLLRKGYQSSAGTTFCSSCRDASTRKSYPSKESRLATIGKAEFLEHTDTTPTLSKSAASFSAQTLLATIHEVGHALGLSHDLGYAYRLGDGSTMITPMLGGYSFLDPDKQPDSYNERQRLEADRSTARYQTVLGQDTIRFVNEYGFNFEW